MLGANNGNKKAVKLLMNWLAAKALLVWLPYESITYAVTVTLTSVITLASQRAEMVLTGHSTQLLSEQHYEDTHVNNEPIQLKFGRPSIE